MAQSRQDLLRQGNGSGADATKFVRSNGSGLFVMDSPSAFVLVHKPTAVTGTQDGSNKVFTIANALTATTEQVFVNGQLLNPGSGNDYILSGTTLTFQAAMFGPAAADVIRVYGAY